MCLKVNKNSKIETENVKNHPLTDEQDSINEKLPKDFYLSTVFLSFTEYPTLFVAKDKNKYIGISVSFSNKTIHRKYY